MNIFYPGQFDKNKAEVSHLAHAQEKALRDKLENSSEKEGLTLGAWTRILGMYIKFIIVYVLVMLLTYYGVQTLGAWRFCRKKSHDEQGAGSFPTMVLKSLKSAALPKDPCRDGARPVLDSWMLQFQGTPDKVVLGTQSQVQVGGNLGLDFCEGSARDRTDLFAGGSHLRSYKKRSTAVITDTVGATLEQQHFFHKPGGAYVYGIGELFVNNSLGIAQEPSGGIGLGSPQFFAKGVGYNFSGDMRYVSEHLDHTAQSLNLAGLRLKQQAHLSGARFSWDEQIWVMPMLNDRHAFQAYALVGPTLTINSWLKLGLSEEEHYVDNAPKPNRRNYLASVLSLTVMRSGGGPK